MTYGLRLERVFDAPPDVVFDAFVDPATQERLHGAEQPDWVVHRCVDRCARRWHLDVRDGSCGEGPRCRDT